MNSQTQKWNADAAKAQVKERQDQVAAAIKKVGASLSPLASAIAVCQVAAAIKKVGASDSEEILANADLIAAAPEMLEALQEIYRVVSDGEKMSDGADKHRMLKNAQWLVAQAIAKAKGGSA